MNVPPSWAVCWEDQWDKASTSSSPGWTSIYLRSALPLQQKIRRDRERREERRMGGKQQQAKGSQRERCDTVWLWLLLLFSRLDEDWFRPFILTMWFLSPHPFMHFLSGTAGGISSSAKCSAIAEIFMIDLGCVHLCVRILYSTFIG